MRLLAILTILALASSSASADERKSIALLEFAGPKGTSVRGDLLRIAAAEGWVASASRLDGRSIREFADDYELDLVIEGAVEKRGRGYEIRIDFVRGATGRSIRKVTEVSAYPSLDAGAKKRLKRELVRVLASIRSRAP